MPVSCFNFIVSVARVICTLSLHDALPISGPQDRRKARGLHRRGARWLHPCRRAARAARPFSPRGRSRDCPLGENRSEEHTSELQSRGQIVCRLLLEKKNRYVYII